MDELTIANPRPEAMASPTSGLFVSVVMPCYNEELFIQNALQNLYDQYDKENYEVVIVDGMSTDRTRELINEFAQKHQDLSLRLVDNPDRTIPRALNLGIEAAKGDLIIRMDSHAAPSAGYVRRCVELLLKDEASVVGMYCRVQPSKAGLMATAIATVVSHPFGIGDASYRLDQAAPQQLVDTVAFGSFRKSVWQQLGGFNEKLHTNEDYDFNYRVRAAGGTVLLDRAEHTSYFARGTLGGLITQYSRYGKWKARMIRLHPSSIKSRHLVAPLFVISLLALPILGLWFWPAWVLLAIELIAYFALAIYFATKISLRQGDLRLMFLLPIVFFTLHITWGVSFLLSIVQPRFKERKPLPV